VWLVGMMGAGKSVVGPALAARLKRRFVDTDAEIERAAGRSIREIFARDGETAFRVLEQQAVEDASREGAVVALGGGAIASTGARERLAENGVVVYLRARPETLLARMGDCRRRPLLADLAPDQRLGRLAALLEERREAYESARITVDTDEATVAEVVNEVVKALDREGVREESA
jgi:shikimate kinase